MNADIRAIADYMDAAKDALFDANLLDAEMAGKFTAARDALLRIIDGGAP